MTERDVRAKVHAIPRLLWGAAVTLVVAVPAACANLSGLSDGHDAGSPDTGVKHADAGSDTGHKVDSGPPDVAPHDATARDASDAGHATDTGRGDAGHDTGVDAGPPSSCVAGGPGLTNCGEDAGESCCTSYLLPAGTFERSYEPDSSVTSARATVSAFRLDKYPVTVGRFRQFIHATNPDSGVAWSPAAGSGKHAYLDGGALNACPAGGAAIEPGWSTDFPFNPTPASVRGAPCPTYTLSPGATENLPMNELTWYDAYAFCIWDGGFLPTLAELEYAAAGGNQQRDYPWGATPPQTTPNGYAIYGCHYPNADADIPDGDTCESVVNLAPVGTATLGAGRWKQLDLTGEIQEWVLDKYSLGYPAGQWDNCVYLEGDGGRFFQGAAWALPITTPAARQVGGHVAGIPDPDIGLRCARAP